MEYIINTNNGMTSEGVFALILLIFFCWLFSCSILLDFKAAAIFNTATFVFFSLNWFACHIQNFHAMTDLSKDFFFRLYGQSLLTRGCLVFVILTNFWNQKICVWFMHQTYGLKAVEWEKYIWNIFVWKYNFFFFHLVFFPSQKKNF